MGGLVGITGFGQSLAGTVVKVELPEVGTHFAAGAKMAVLDTVAFVPSQVRRKDSTVPVEAPLDCQVIEVNEMLGDDPELVNNEAESDGWLVRIKFSGKPSSLMDVEGYGKYV